MPIVLLAVLLGLASVGTLLLVSLAYGLGLLLGRWIPLSPFELTGLCLVGLLAVLVYLLRWVHNLADRGQIEAALDGVEADYVYLDAYPETDDARPQAWGPGPRPGARKGRQRR